MLVELETFDWATTSNYATHNKYIKGTRMVVINTDMIIYIEPRHDLMYKEYTDVFAEGATLENVDYYEIVLGDGNAHFTFYIKSDVYKNFKESYIENLLKNQMVL